jgi:hypothetical protein
MEEWGEALRLPGGRFLRDVMRIQHPSVTFPPPPGSGSGCYALRYALLSCAVGGVAETENSIRLRTFLALDDVKLDLIALFQCFVAVQLDCRVVNENIGTIIASDESVALGIVEPLDLSFVLSHRLLPFLLVEVLRRRSEKGESPLNVVMTKKRAERLIEIGREMFTKWDKGRSGSTTLSGRC